MDTAHHSHALRFAASEDHLWHVAPLDLHVARYTIHQRLSACYRVELDVTLGAQGLPTERIGQRATFCFWRDGVAQHMHGIVDAVALKSVHNGVATCTLTLVPRLFAATRDRGDRVFVNATAREIIDTVLGELLGPTGDSYSVASHVETVRRQICIQYQECTLDFVLRLMAEEGLHFHFVHPSDASREQLVVGDANNVFVAAMSAPLRYAPARDTHGPHISLLHYPSQSRQADSLARCQDFRDEGPAAHREAAAQSSAPPPAQAAVYTTHHVCSDAAQSQSIARARARIDTESRAIWHAAPITGASNCLALAAGATFVLLDHPEDSCNQSYLVIACTHTGAAFDPHDARGRGKGEAPYANTFDAIAYHRPFRTQAPKTRDMAALHTGTVLAPAHEEVDTDALGRICVRLHWDTAHTPIWLRTSQMLAKTHQGFLAIPRAGTEVIVGFLHGHIDHPVVLGTLYNGLEPPHYEPQAHKTRTSLRTHLIPFDGGYNELTFEDDQAKACIALHAQKDFSSRVKGCHIDLVAAESRIRPLGRKFATLDRASVGLDAAKFIGVAPKSLFGKTYSGGENAMSRPDRFIAQLEDLSLRRLDERHATSLPNEDLTSLLAPIITQAIAHHLRDHAEDVLKQPSGQDAADFHSPLFTLAGPVGGLAGCMANQSPNEDDERMQRVARGGQHEHVGRDDGDDSDEPNESDDDVTRDESRKSNESKPYPSNRPWAKAAKKGRSFFTQAKSQEAKKLTTGFWALFEFGKKFEAKTRKRYNSDFAKGFHSPQGMRHPTRHVSPLTAYYLLYDWFATFLMPGTAALYKRLMFTDGGIMDITTKDRRMVTIRKDIAHVGGDQSIHVYGDRFATTSGAEHTVVMGDAKRDVRGHLHTRVAGNETFEVSKNVRHTGAGKMIAHYDGAVRWVSRDTLSLHADAEIKLATLGEHSMKVGQDSLQHVAGKATTRAKKIDLTAEQNLTITQGQTTIVLAGGKVTIKTGDVAFDVDSFEVNAKKRVRINGAKVDIGG